MGAVTAMAVVGVASAAMGAESSRKANRKAGQLAAQGRAVFEGIEVPTIEEQKIILQNPALMGQYTPEQIQFMELNASAMEGVEADPEAVAQQEDALAKMAEVAEGGYTEGDKAGMRQINREVEQNAKARRDAILSEMAQRGVLGSGMELQAQLAGNQQAMQEEANASDRAMQQAQARALQAISQQGGMASQLRAQDVGEQTDKAKARDAINQFNTQNRQQLASQNVGNRNQAQMFNLQQRQAQEDARVAARNQEEMHNKGLRQQQYQNEMQRASGLAGQYNAQAQAASKAGADKAKMYGGIASGMMNMAGGMLKPTPVTNVYNQQGVSDDLDNIMKNNKDIF